MSADRRTLIRVKTRFALAIFLAATCLAAPASAEDQRPCVSKVEWNGIVGANRGENLTRHQVEERWDVAGLGWSTYVQWFSDGDRDYVMAYPRCGYSRSEGWYGAAYRLEPDETSRIWSIVSWRDPDAKLHGHARIG